MMAVPNTDLPNGPTKRRITPQSIFYLQIKMYIKIHLYHI